MIDTCDLDSHALRRVSRLIPSESVSLWASIRYAELRSRYITSRMVAGSLIPLLDCVSWRGQ